MEATKLLLNFAVFGLIMTVNTESLNGNGDSGRCSTRPCTCDDYGRLTCDCKGNPELLILASNGDTGLNSHLSRITVTDCPNVLVTNSSVFQIASLLSLDLMNVANLTLEPDSFKLAKQAVNVRISIRNASIDVLPRVFHGDVESIVLESVSIRHIQAFAFSNIENTQTITLENCEVGSIEAGAFRKFEAKFLHVIGGSFGLEVPSRIMNNVEVSDKFMLDGVRMGTVRSSAFVVRGPKTVAVLNCEIDHLEGEAFDVTARGAVIFKNNHFGHVNFGAFLAISAETGSRNPQNSIYGLMFKNNSLTTFEEGSLVFDRASFKPELSQVLINQACDCAQVANWKNQILNQSVAYSRLYSRSNSDQMKAQAQQRVVEDPNSFLCLTERQGDALAVPLVEYEAKRCAPGGSTIFVGLMSAGAILALLLLAGLGVLCYRNRRGRQRQEGRWISVPTSAPDVVSPSIKKNGILKEPSVGVNNPSAEAVDSRITMVVPDGRLYRETEFHVIVEKAEPLTTEL